MSVTLGKLDFKDSCKDKFCIEAYVDKQFANHGPHCALLRLQQVLVCGAPRNQLLHTADILLKLGTSAYSPTMYGDGVLRAIRLEWSGHTVRDGLQGDEAK